MIEVVDMPHYFSYKPKILDMLKNDAPNKESVKRVLGLHSFKK